MSAYLDNPTTADENEQNRLAIMNHTSLGSEAYRAVQPISGEMLAVAVVTGTTATVIFRRKYTQAPGTRTVILDDNDGLAWVVRLDVFAPTPTAPRERPTMAPRPRVGHVLERPTAPRPPMPATPADGESVHMSFTYHVRSCGTGDVICTTTSLDNAIRLAGLWGNADVWQFSSRGEYHDHTLSGVSS